MGIFQWIEFKDELTARVAVPVGINEYLAEIPAMLSWESEDSAAEPETPNFDDLERAAQFAWEQKRQSGFISTRNIVDALSEQLDTLPADEPWPGYPERLPQNIAFVLGAYALLLIDNAIGYYSQNEHALVFDAMVAACDAMHASGFYHGGALGMEQGHRANSSKGGQARNAKYRQLETWAVEQYKAKKWKSPHQASHELKEIILSHAKTLHVTLSPYRAQQTIYGWFLDADKPDAGGVA